MPFDENPPSPDRIVDPHKPDTKINIELVVGVIVFFLFGSAAVYFFAIAGR